MQFSIVNYSDVERLSDFRIDSHYWHPEFIRNGALINSNATVALFVKSNIENIKSSPIGRKFEYLEISNISITYGGDYKTVEIIEGEEPDRAHHILQKNDVVVSTVRPNRNAVALIQESGIIGSSGLCVLRADNINPKYLYIFCKTDYFVKCLIRADKASMYPAVSNADILKTAIFVPSDNFQKSIVEQVDKAFQKQELSKEIYQQAEYLLLEELGLGDWQPTHELTYSKNYSDTVEAGRIDAEYYQPKYDEIIDAIKGYRGGYSTVGKEFIQNKTTFQIEDDKLYQYVEIGSVNVSNGEIVPEKVLGVDAPANAKRILHKNDVIISKVRTYRGAITIVEKQGYVGSGAFTILAENGRVNKETLLAFLHSKPLLAWSLKPNTGASYPVIKDDDILNLPIPIILKDEQQKIQAKVMESFKLRTDSKKLLENAKRAVEIAIKQDEAAAIKSLNSAT